MGQTAPLAHRHCLVFPNARFYCFITCEANGVVRLGFNGLYWCGPRVAQLNQQPLKWNE